MRLLSITALLTTAALGLSACGGGDDTGGGSEKSGATEVNLKTFIFNPDPVTVEAGTEITWTNEDAAVHNVTSGPRGNPDGKFKGKLDKSGGTYSETFDEPGIYKYFCSLHSGEGMEAEVVVE